MAGRARTLTEGPDAGLLLGPLLRYVDETSATVWVRTAQAGEVALRLDDGRSWATRTFAVHGHHYALVEVTDLAPGTCQEYTVEVNGTPVWPLPDMPAPSVLRTMGAHDPVLAFGSCRTSVSHDLEGHLSHGVDALRTFGMAMAHREIPVDRWPDLLLLLGDQVYADELGDEIKDFIASRRSLDEPPGEELQDFAEYVQLYQVAWAEPWIRWLLSCLPSLMIFDDHDVRDDWNTSWQWREAMESTSWWQDRIVGALGSYWVYQHLGNLSPEARAEDEIWSYLMQQQEQTHEEVDLTRVLDDFAARVDQKPNSYSWSFARDVGEARLLVVDSRAARVLDEDERSMLDPEEMRWLDEHLRGDCSHLLIGTSLPFLLPMGLHHLEGWSEALVEGEWGERSARGAERLRRGMDLEHWAAFDDAFRRVAQMVEEVADGRRGEAPRTIAFLSGDVHHSYIAEVERGDESRILQFVCSPIRNPLPRPMRAANVVAAHKLAGLVGAPLAQGAHIGPPPFSWRTLAGPWYDNNLAVMKLGEGDVEVTWWTGEIEGMDHDHPHLRPVALIDLRDGESARVLTRRRRA